MLASEFEFRPGRWFILGIFCVGLACYWFDPQNSGEVLAKDLRTHIGLLQAYSPRSSVRGLFLMAALIVLAGGMIRTWGEAYLRADVVHDSRVRTERLVADGPFRYTRNPLYFGALIGVFGAGVLSSRRTGWIVQMAIAVVCCYHLISREEREGFVLGPKGFPQCRFLVSKDKQVRHQPVKYCIREDTEVTKKQGFDPALAQQKYVPCCYVP